VRQIQPRHLRIRLARLRRTLGLACAVALGLAPSQAHASAAGIPDGDSATLIALLLEAVKQSASAAEMLTAVQGSLETAQNTLAVARAATETVNEFRYLTENPDEIFDAAEAAFAKTFPEVEGIRREADGLRRSLADGPNGELNPYALQDTLNAIGRTQESYYDTLVALDEGIYGLSEGHLALVSRQDTIHTQAAAVFRETMDPGCRLTGSGPDQHTVCGLDPKRATVLMAKSQVLSAASLGIIGEVVTEQLRLAKLEAIRQLDDGARMSASTLDHARGLAEVAASVDETLDPTQGEAKAATFIERPAR
jgi:hypothetical protein